MSTREALSEASLVSRVQDGQLTAKNLSLESYTRKLWMGLKKKAAYLPGC